jgi:hypothetical protein
MPACLAILQQQVVLDPNRQQGGNACQGWEINRWRLSSRMLMSGRGQMVYQELTFSSRPARTIFACGQYRGASIRLAPATTIRL